MRTFVIGDIHGAHKALVQCLERSGFDRENDLLITLGDVCDGWPYVFECVEELLKLRRIDLMGNHDYWFLQWLETTVHMDYWIQGGGGTLHSYLGNCGVGKYMQSYKIYRADLNGLMQAYIAYKTDLLPSDIPEHHVSFFKKMAYYYEDGRGRLFVHAGFDRMKSIEDNRCDDATIFWWDRKLWDKALSCKSGVKLSTIDCFEEIFIGHTATTKWNENVPMHAGGVWNLDTGAGRNGKLTIMDVDTKEFWQSDLVQTLYADQAKSSSEKI